MNDNYFFVEVINSERQLFLCRSNKQWTTIKGNTLSRGTNARLPFSVNVNLNLSKVTQMTMHCVQIAVLSRVRDNNTESSKGSSHILGSFSNNDGHGYEDVTWKMKSRWFKLYALIQPRSVRQIMSNASSFLGSWILKTVQKRKVVALSSSLPQNVKLGTFTS